VTKVVEKHWLTGSQRQSRKVNDARLWSTIWSKSMTGVAIKGAPDDMSHDVVVNDK
jgi:hypothetical protein